MTNQQQEKILDKVRKLIALSKSPNENEAAAAAEKAHAIIAEHDLSMLDVMKDPGQTSERIVIDRSIVTPSNPWRRRLAMAVAQLFFCKYFYTPFDGKNQHCFVGTEVNTIATKLMFEYLLKAINRLAQEGSRSVPADQKSPYRVSFREACSDRLCYRIAMRIEDAKEGDVITTASGKNLPALLDLYAQNEKLNSEFIEQQVGTLKSVKTRVSYLNQKGVDDGAAAGDRIALDQQIGHEDRKQLN